VSIANAICIVRKFISALFQQSSRVLTDGVRFHPNQIGHPLMMEAWGIDCFLNVHVEINDIADNFKDRVYDRWSSGTTNEPKYKYYLLHRHWLKVLIFRIILVNDGSTDSSDQVINELASLHSWIQGITLMRNYGQHNSLLCGIRAAQYEIIVTLDDDLQHLPEDIPKLLSELRRGFDVVYGVAHERRQSFWRNMASKCIRLALTRAIGPMAWRVSAFRAFRSQIRAAFSKYESPEGEPPFVTPQGNPPLA
jgi:Glycosyl transferase family 2